MRWKYVALSLLLSSTSACVVGARGRAATNGNEVVLYVELLAPRPPIATVTTVSSQELSGGFGRAYLNDDALVVPHGTVVWRVEDEAVGLGAGVSALFSYLGGSVGAQHTFGDTGSTGAFAALGINVFAVCGCM